MALLELEHGLGVEQVEFPVPAPLDVSAAFEFLGADGPVGESVFEPLQGFLGHDVDADSTDARGRPGEIFFDEITLQADGLEYLRAAIRLDGRDAHLGHHLEDALVERGNVVLPGRVGVDVVEKPVSDHVVDGFKNEIRVDGRGPEAEQQAYVMHLARFARFEDKPDARSGSLPHEMVMNAGGGQKGGDRGVLFRYPSIREDDEAIALLDGAAGLSA